MNNQVFKVCPLCGANSILLHSIIQSVGGKYWVESKVSCTDEKECGASLRKVTSVQQEKVMGATHEETMENLERSDEIKLAGLSLLERWNTRDPKFVYLKNTR